VYLPVCIVLVELNVPNNFFNQHTLLALINSSFNKVFSYTNILSSITKRNTTKLQSIKNFACRIVCGARKQDHVTPLLREINWLPVASKLYLRDAIITFKRVSGRAPKYLSSKFIKRGEVSSRKTWSCQTLHTPLSKLPVVKGLFVLDLWILGIISSTHIRFLIPHAFSGTA